MRIAEYSEVDPLKVMLLNKLGLDYALTPEEADSIRQSDPRPFPCLAIYAVDDGEVLGQVGIFRLPMISIEGREDVGGIWAVCTHPQYAAQGVASFLLDEAHDRMRMAGLRFSTLGTDRYRLAHRLYQNHGYEETNVLAAALTRWETAHQPTRLRAEPAGAAGYTLVEQVFREVAKDSLGFAWRHTPFGRLQRVDLSDIWLVCENRKAVGYALTRSDPETLKITDLVLRSEVDAAEAIASITGELKRSFVQVRISRPVHIASLREAGFQIASPSWNGFMIKALLPEVSVEDARRLFGIGTDRFLISWLDVT